MQETKRIKLQAFSSNVPNLFEQFFLMGYSNDEKSKDILRNIKLPSNESNTTSEKELLNNRQQYKSISYEVIENSTYPTILSSISNNSSNQIGINGSSAIKFIFPAKPKVVYISNIDETNNTNYLHMDTFIEHKKYNVIFFLNSDLLDAKEKNFIYGFALVFYEKYKSSQNGLYLLPKALAFLSKYPYYSHMHTLANEILKIFLTTSHIPIEIIIFNIINYSPSKVKEDFTLNYYPDNYHNNKLYSIRQMNFPFLSGYPLIDLNVSEIFNIIPVELIIKAFIINFLEIDMLVFSNTIELLNVFLYFIYSVNFPCNDTIYLWHIISVSKDELTNSNIESQFIGKPFTTMLGVNCSYNDNINVSRFSSEVCVVDLDNKVIKFNYENKNKSNSIIDISSLLTLLSSIFESKDTPIDNRFEQNIKILYQKLDSAATKVIDFNPTPQKQYIPKFFEINESIYQQNKQIQEIFYSFVLNVIKPFYHSFRFDISFLKLNSNSVINNSRYNSDYPIMEEIHHIKWKENEKGFYGLLMNASKYAYFIYNFLYNYNTLESYQLSLLFSEIFLNYGNSIESEYLFRHFDIIDSFYQKYLPEQSNSNINSHHLYSICNYSKLIKKCLKQNIFLHSDQMLQWTPSKKTIDLDLTVLYQYVSIINNFDIDDSLNLFPTRDLMSKDTDAFVNYFDITQHFEACLINYRSIKQKELVLSSMVLFLALASDFMNEADFYNNLKVVFELIYQQKHFVRNNLTILLYVYCTKSLQARESNMNCTHYILGYHLILEYLYSKHIYPNMDLSQIIIQFKGIENKAAKKPSLMIFPNEDEANSSKERKERFTSISLETTQLDSGFDKSVDSSDSRDLLHTSCRNSFEMKTIDYSLLLTRNSCREKTRRTIEIIKLIECVYNEGDFHFNCEICDKTISPMLLFMIKSPRPFRCEINIYSPLKLYKTCVSLMTSWIRNNMTKESLDIVGLQKAMINLLFYEQTILYRNRLVLPKDLFQTTARKNSS